MDDSWFYSKWRPAIAWLYLFLCLFDFFIAPVFVGMFSYFTHTSLIMWDPITLKGGAILHASLGGISGIAAWSRGKEKIAALNVIDNLTPPDGIRRQGQDG